MSERAKEIATKIIADVWPMFHCQWMEKAIEAAVEKHMLKPPHRVRDRDGYVWEQLSNGRYAMKGTDFASIQKDFSPLTEVQGTPNPDPIEVKSMQERVTELERMLSKSTDECVQWKNLNKQSISKLECWRLIAEKVDVQSWDGVKYSSDSEWVDRVLAKISATDPSELAAARARIAELEKQCAQRGERIAELESNLESMKGRTDRLQKMLDDYGQELIDTRKHVDDLQGLLAEERSISAMRAAQLAELENQLDEANAKIAITTVIGGTLGEKKPEAEWQLVSEDSWVYGVKVRGAVRDSKANVYFNGRDWVWYLNDSTVRGEADYFSKAINAAEEAMGVA